MTVDPRTPVIVGVGQTQQRVADAATALSPVELLALATRLADEDAGASRSLVAGADTVAVVDLISWRYPDAAAALARAVGASPRHTVMSTVGGNSPEMLLHHLLPGIASGERDVVVLGGVECMYTRLKVRSASDGGRPDWEQTDDPPCPAVIGDDRPGSSDYEMAHLALAPTAVYPLFETALRAAAGRSVAEHQAHTGALWAHFAAVAAENPHAWSRTAWTGEEIVTPTADNRMVTFPYTKRMCANLQVDQAAALVLCSYGTAADAGVPKDRMVFPWSGADATDHYFFTERESLAASPAIRIAGTAALQAAGVGIDDVARFDLYSCFPSAVQLALGALGLAGPTAGDSRPLTQTGGLPFAGGPGNAYVVQSLAAMTDALRAHPGELGMVTALGWYATKHAVGVYGTEPPPRPYTVVPKAQTQATVDALPRREPAGAFSGAATVEATSVIMERDGTPGVGIVAALASDGRRVLAGSRDADALRSMTEDAWEGRSIRIAAGEGANVVEA